MVTLNDDEFSRIKNQLRDIQYRLQRLELDFAIHRGNTGVGFNSPNLPHPNISSIRQGVYTITNQTNDRTYDADASSVAELADVLSQVIADLQRLGILG